MSNNPLDNPDVAKQVIEAQQRDHTVGRCRDPTCRARRGRRLTLGRVCAHARGQPYFMWTISFLQVGVLVGLIIFNGGFEMPSINYMLVRRGHDS